MLHRRVRELIVVGLLAAAFTGAFVAWVVWPDGGAESQEVIDPVAVQPVLQQLGPGTTLHMVDVVYRRYGPAAAVIPASEGPETRRIETWITFDDQGALAELRIEVRDTDGTLLSTGVLEGDDLVFRDASDVETDRQANVRAGMTVDGLKASISTAITKAHEALSNRPDAPLGEVDGRAVVILEDRKPFRSGVPVATRPGRSGTCAKDDLTPPATCSTGFELPHVADLNPVDELRRSYVLPDEFRTLRSEVVIVGEDGTETVVESRDHEVFEVIPSQAVP